MREADVRHQSVAEKGGHAPAGAIDELIGDHEVERLVLVLQAADGAGRQQVFHAQDLETVDIGAEIQLRGQEPVTDAVAGEKSDTLSTQSPEHVRRGWIAKRCADMALFAIGELRHVVQTAPPDDSDGDGHR